MTIPKSSYYSTLRPFRQLFESGFPILTWHKLGPRPNGVRLKGLYLSAEFFEQQLAELRKAEFYSSSPVVPMPKQIQSGHEIALTFDDGFVNVLKFGLAPLNCYGFSAIQFLVADRIGATNDWETAEGEVKEFLMDKSQIREWLAAGHDIGSHTLTHPHLTQLPVNRAREEIASSKKKLEDLFGREVEHFCYPYGNWCPRTRELVAAAGYRTACTVDFGVNRPGDSPFELKRITARYPSRNLKSIVRRFAERFAAKPGQRMQLGLHQL